MEVEEEREQDELDEEDRDEEDCEEVEDVAQEGGQETEGSQQLQPVSGQQSACDPAPQVGGTSPHAPKELEIFADEVGGELEVLELQPHFM